MEGEGCEYSKTLDHPADDNGTAFATGEQRSSAMHPYSGSLVAQTSVHDSFFGLENTEQGVFATPCSVTDSQSQPMTSKFFVDIGGDVDDLLNNIVSNLWSDDDDREADDVDSFIDRGSLKYYSYANQDSSVAGVMDENAQISSYAPIDSRVERISALMNGLSLGGSSSSINVLAPSASSSIYAAASRSGEAGQNLAASSNSGNYEVETNYPRFLNGLKKYVLDLARSKDGVWYLISLMENGNRENTILILWAVVTDVYAVITCANGLLLFTNLLEFCDETQKEFLFAKIVSDPDSVIFCSTTFYGSKALVELVDHLKGSGLVRKLPSILATEIESLVLDCSASSVIKHCLAVLDADQCQWLYEAMIGRALELAMHTHGCTLLYALIDSVKNGYRIQLFNIFADSSLQLAIHPSGNYVLSYILEMRHFATTIKITSHLFGCYKTLAKDKHGSHVVEKCIESVGIYRVIDEFLNHSTSQELEEIACHEFGNYVMKKALKTTEICDLTTHKALVRALLPGLARLKQSPFGKAVYKLLKNESLSKTGKGEKKYRHYYA